MAQLAFQRRAVLSAVAVERYRPHRRRPLLAGQPAARARRLRQSTCCFSSRRHRAERGGARRSTATDFLRLTSRGIGQVHGIDFIDDRTLAVANRDGDVTILELPPGAVRRPRLRCRAGRPASARAGSCELDTPGSVAVRKEWWGKVSLLVCNNFTPPNHPPCRRSPRRVTGEVELGPAVQRGLEIPDGIAVSPDRRWIAVSSHNTQRRQAATAARCS